MASRKERPPIQVEFGDRLRAAREAAGVSQERLALEIDLHRTYVSSIERGERNVSLRNIVLLARGVGVDPADLVRGLK